MSPAQLIEQLKALVANLGEFEETVEFDKRLAEIDLLLYKLRSATLPKIALRLKEEYVSSIHEALKEILGE